LTLNTLCSLGFQIQTYGSRTGGGCLHQ
jgi:hypothetical protein